MTMPESLAWVRRPISKGPTLPGILRWITRSTCIATIRTHIGTTRRMVIHTILVTTMDIRAASAIRSTDEGGDRFALGLKLPEQQQNNQDQHHQPESACRIKAPAGAVWPSR